VSFVGAGPGAADLITVRAAHRVAEADVVVCIANPLAPDWIRDNVRPSAEVIDSTRLGDDGTLEIYRRAAREKLRVVVVIPGDPVLWGDVRAHHAFCVRLGLDPEIVPGITPMIGAAALAGRELTPVDGRQAVLLARPEVGENLGRELAAHDGTLALELPAARAAVLADELLAAGFATDTPVLVGYKVSQPGEVLVETTLVELASVVKQRRLWRHAVFLIGSALRATATRPRRVAALTRPRSDRWIGMVRGSAPSGSTGEPHPVRTGPDIEVSGPPVAPSPRAETPSPQGAEPAVAVTPPSEPDLSSVETPAPRSEIEPTDTVTVPACADSTEPPTAAPLPVATEKPRTTRKKAVPRARTKTVTPPVEPDPMVDSPDDPPARTVAKEVPDEPTLAFELGEDLADPTPPDQVDPQPFSTSTPEPTQKPSPEPNSESTQEPNSESSPEPEETEPPKVTPKTAAKPKPRPANRPPVATAFRKKSRSA
jgi:precorrin-4/cobalt-precorrin-4 C11-methyltransferase